MLQAVMVVALACLIGLMLAATFGLIHNGDDFDFDITPGPGHGGRGDVIVLPGVLA